MPGIAKNISEILSSTHQHTLSTAILYLYRHAKTILISCELGAHIHPAGFHDWNRENTHDTVYYAEYASFPATSDYRPLSDRADFVQNLNEQQAGYFAKELVLGDWAPDKL